jgi:hypothetical protein
MVAQVALEGHFSEGAAGTIHMVSGIEAPFMLELVEPHVRYLNRVALDGLVVRIDHQLRAVDGTTRVLIRATIEGDRADSVGPMLDKETPKALAVLIGMAEGDR